MYIRNCRRLRQVRVYCSMCGREIGLGEAYWFCSGSRICDDCLKDYARQELEPFREIRGEEGCQ